MNGSVPAVNGCDELNGDRPLLVVVTSFSTCTTVSLVSSLFATATHFLVSSSISDKLADYSQIGGKDAALWTAIFELCFCLCKRSTQCDVASAGHHGRRACACGYCGCCCCCWTVLATSRESAARSALWQLHHPARLLE